jgi:cyanophycinase
MIPDPTIPTRAIGMDQGYCSVTTRVEADLPSFVQKWSMTTNGLLALVGGFEWTEGCTFDATLLKASGGPDVLVLPTAAAYQHPERVVLQAAEWFAPLGGQVEGLMVIDRTSANDPGMAGVVRTARFIYLAGGSPLHLKSVLKGSATFDALREAWASGAVVAGSAAGAMVLTDPMVDPRGGALTVGLGLIDQLAVVPQFGDGLEDLHGQKLQRTVAMAPDGLPVVGIPDRTALLRAGDGTWSYEGVAPPVVFLNGELTEGLSALGG